MSIIIYFKLQFWESLYGFDWNKVLFFLILMLPNWETESFKVEREKKTRLNNMQLIQKIFLIGFHAIDQISFRRNFLSFILFYLSEFYRFFSEQIKCTNDCLTFKVLSNPGYFKTIRLIVCSNNVFPVEVHAIH